MALHCPALVASRICIPVAHGSVTSGGQLWPATNSRTQYRLEANTLSPTPPPPHRAFCDKGLFACPGVLARGAGFWSDTHLGTYEDAVLGQKSGDATLCTPSALLQIAGISQKGDHIVVWHPVFVTDTQGTLPRSPA